MSLLQLAFGECAEIVFLNWEATGGRDVKAERRETRGNRGFEADGMQKSRIGDRDEADRRYLINQSCLSRRSSFQIPERVLERSISEVILDERMEILL